MPLAVVLDAVLDVEDAVVAREESLTWPSRLVASLVPLPRPLLPLVLSSLLVVILLSIISRQSPKLLRAKINTQLKRENTYVPH